jgi:hypothetical protein
VCSLAFADLAAADPAASTAAASRLGLFRLGPATGQTKRRGNTQAGSTTGHCRPGRRTADKADGVVRLGWPPVELNERARADVDRSFPPHGCRVPAAQRSALCCT